MHFSQFLPISARICAESAHRRSVTVSPQVRYGCSKLGATPVLFSCHAHNGHTDSQGLRMESRLFSIRLVCLTLFSKNRSAIEVVKLWFSNMYFVGFYSVQNFIVILFNLMYPVFVVRIYCKSCVIVRESMKTQAIEVMRVFVGISRLSIPRKVACALHMTGMRRVSTDGGSCVLRVSHR